MVIRRFIEAHRSKFLLIVPIGILWAFRLYHIIQFGDRAFGYDFGIYRGLISRHFDRIFDKDAPSFGFAAFSNILQLLHVSVDSILYGLPIMIGIVTALALYAIVYHRTKDVVAAFFATIMYACSIIQFEAYHAYYIRNILALLTLGVIWISYEQYPKIVPLALILIGTIHPISLVPVLLALGIHTICFHREKFFKMFIYGVSAGVVVGVLNYKELLPYFNLVRTIGISANSFVQNGMSEFRGQFLTIPEGFLYMLPYLPISIYGLYREYRKFLDILLMLIVCCLLMLSGLVLYERLLLIIDVCLIIGAGVGIGYVLREYGKNIYTILMVTIFSLALFLNTLHHVYYYEPALTNDEFFVIKYLDTNTKNSVILSFSSYYAPWIYGFTKGSVIAPGMFEENRWNESEWKLFWTTEDPEVRGKLMSVYPKPVYMFVGDQDRFNAFPPLLDPGFSSVIPYLWVWK